MNELLNSLDKSKDWNLYCTDSNAYIYSMSTYNYRNKRRCIIYATIVFENDKLEQIKSISIEESWEDNLEIKNFKIAVFYVDCKIKIIEGMIKDYIFNLPF